MGFLDEERVHAFERILNAFLGKTTPVCPK
jgi:hypothetical protein